MRHEALDLRDDLTWVAIELSPQGEAKVEEGTIAKTIRADLEVSDDHPVFVPSMIYRKGGRLVVLHLLEGYIFVASGLPEIRYFSLERRPYVNQVMSSTSGPHHMRVPSVIANAKVSDLKQQLRSLVSSDIEVGAEVTVLDGLYKGLDGKVIGVENDDAFVHVTMRSISIIATIPRVFLESREP